MQASKKPQRFSSARWWFLLALGLSALFLIYTAINAAGLLDTSTLSVEHWLLNRPIGRVDCVFFEWRHLGEVPASLFLVLVLGVICWRIGYSGKIVLVLLVLLILCIGVEYIGKEAFTLSLPPNLFSGMTNLSCPQILKEPISVRLETMASLWWKIPTPAAGQMRWVHMVAQMPVVPISASSSLAIKLRSYPGGHAARWCFLGLIASWLCWKHIRYRVRRTLFTVIFFLASFIGGFMQFYIAVHVLTDTIAGYLLGAAAASCAIGFLIMFDANNEKPCFQKDL